MAHTVSAMIEPIMTSIRLCNSSNLRSTFFYNYLFNPTKFYTLTLRILLSDRSIFIFIFIIVLTYTEYDLIKVETFVISDIEIIISNY